jgi:hypothetical protein
MGAKKRPSRCLGAQKITTKAKRDLINVEAKRDLMQGQKET